MCSITRLSVVYDLYSVLLYLRILHSLHCIYIRGRMLGKDIILEIMF